MNLRDTTRDLIDQVEQQTGSMVEVSPDHALAIMSTVIMVGRCALPAHVIRYTPTLEGMTLEQVREIGGEIAFLSRRGLDINNPAPKYSLWTLLDDFSGMHLVSIIYAAFQQFAIREDMRIDLVRNYDRALGMRGQWIGEGSSHMKVPTW